MKRTYVLEYEGTPLAAYTSMGKAQAEMRLRVKDWRHQGAHPRGLPHPANAVHHAGETSWGSRCTAWAEHDGDRDGRAEGGLWFLLLHRGARVGKLRIVRSPQTDGEKG